MRRLVGLGFFGSVVAFSWLVACGGGDEVSEFSDDAGNGSSSSGDVPPGKFDPVSADASAPPPGEGGATVDATPVVCGDGVLGGSETCDDKNTAPGDGCSATCIVESDYVCLVPGKPCAKIGACGDAMLKSGEQCDDGNGDAADGCSSTCQIEEGWICPVLGAACRAAACGDGKRAGDEECDDGDLEDGDGCSKSCRLEDGYKCATPGQPCTPTVCGDNAREGLEQCDDGNTTPYDGCSPTCTKEPVCPKQGGVCAGACGDGILFPGEECDDGNTRAGDGCSATCKREPGFSCTEVVQQLPATLAIPLVLRDFSRGDKPNIPSAGCTSAAGCPNGHPDFQTVNGAKTGMVGKLFDDVDVANIGRLDADGKPVLACLQGLDACKATSAQSFAQWYRTLPGNLADPSTRVNHTFVQDLTLTLNASNPADPFYEFASTDFFPLNGQGFGNQWDGNEGGGDRNFHFTSELRFWFLYDAAAPAPRFDFRGDDDVWVFVNGRLAVDIGGVHGATDGSLVLDAGNAAKLGLASGQVYEFALFQAERRRTQSNYRVTLRGFVRAKSTCVPVCGDGIRTKTEVCDDGPANTPADAGAPGYGKCAADCLSRGPFCGDGTVNGSEVCDDGVFNGGYGKCKADCSGPGPKCGDGQVQAIYGEVCDDGAGNDTNVPPAAPAYGKCSADCRARPSCGDGIVQAPETCEPPNSATCNASCQLGTGVK